MLSVTHGLILSQGFADALLEGWESPVLGYFTEFLQARSTCDASASMKALRKLRKAFAVGRLSQYRSHLDQQCAEEYLTDLLSVMAKEVSEERGQGSPNFIENIFIGKVEVLRQSR